MTDAVTKLSPEHECPFRAILDRSPDGLVVCEDSGRIIYFNDAIVQLSGTEEPESALNVLAETFYAEPERDLPIVLEQLEEHGAMLAYEVRVPESWAPVEWVELSIQQVDVEGRTCHLATVRDVGRRKKLERERMRIISVQRLLNETILEGSLGEMIRSACAKLADVYGSDWAGVALLNSDRRGEFLRYRWTHNVPPEVEELRFDRDGHSSLTAVAAERGYAVIGDYQQEGPDAIPRRIESVKARVRAVEAVSLRDRQGILIGVLSLFSSTPGAFQKGENKISLRMAARELATIIEAKKLEEEIRVAGITDGLTGLYNTRHFYRRLSDEMSRARRSGGPLTVMLFDLDHFKEYNDSSGHVAGDHLLRRVGRIVSSTLRKGSDSAFRYGGDEFVVLLPDTDSERARRVAERIRQRIRNIRLAEVSVSIGLAEQRGEASPEELVRRADRAMYEAKEAGRDRIKVDRPERDRECREKD